MIHEFNECVLNFMEDWSVLSSGIGANTNQYVATLECRRCEQVSFCFIWYARRKFVVSCKWKLHAFKDVLCPEHGVVGKSFRMAVRNLVENTKATFTYRHVFHSLWYKRKRVPFQEANNSSLCIRSWCNCESNILLREREERGKIAVLAYYYYTPRNNHRM